MHKMILKRSLEFVSCVKFSNNIISKMIVFYFFTFLRKIKAICYKIIDSAGTGQFVKKVTIYKNCK